MSNVVDLNRDTFEPRPVPQILARAAGAKLESVIVVGWQEDGSLYFRSSEDETAEMNLLLDLAKAHVIKAVIE